MLGVDPADVETVTDALIRDQRQGGATIMTAISSVEIAMWDLLGKAEGQPVYVLLGGRARDRRPAYANSWYGDAVCCDSFRVGPFVGLEAGVLCQIRRALADGHARRLGPGGQR